MDGHAVTWSLDLDAEFLSEVCGEFPRMGAPNSHAEVREDRELRFGVANDALGVVETGMGELRPTLHQHQMDDHHVGFVLLRDAVVVLGVGDPAELVAEAEAIGLSLVHMTWSSGEGQSVD